MKNFIQPGKSIEITFASDASSGDGVVLNDIFGVADHDVDVSVEPQGTLQLEGVFEFVRDASDVFLQGGKAYWDNGNSWVTILPNGGANKLIGVSIEAKTAAAGNIEVRLNGTSTL